MRVVPAMSQHAGRARMMIFQPFSGILSAASRSSVSAKGLATMLVGSIGGSKPVSSWWWWGVGSVSSSVGRGS